VGTDGDYSYDNSQLQRYQSINYIYKKKIKQIKRGGGMWQFRMDYSVNHLHNNGGNVEIYK
jgi:hypothetical protein